MLSVLVVSICYILPKVAAMFILMATTKFQSNLIATKKALYQLIKGFL